MINFYHVCVVLMHTKFTCCTIFVLRMKITGILLLAVLIAAMVSVVMGEGWAADEKGNILVIYKYEGGNAKLPLL